MNRLLFYDYGRACQSVYALDKSFIYMMYTQRSRGLDYEEDENMGVICSDLGLLPLLSRSLVVKDNARISYFFHILNYEVNADLGRIKLFLRKMKLNEELWLYNCPAFRDLYRRFDLVHDSMTVELKEGGEIYL